MTTTEPTPTRRRGPIRYFLVIGAVLVVLAGCVADHAHLHFGWNVYLCSGIVAVILDKIFPNASV